MHPDVKTPYYENQKIADDYQYWLKQELGIDADPAESHNAVDDDKYSGRVAEMEQILIRELAWREEGFVKDGKLVPGAPCHAVLSRAKREIE